MMKRKFGFSLCVALLTMICCFTGCNLKPGGTMSSSGGTSNSEQTTSNSSSTTDQEEQKPNGDSSSGDTEQTNPEENEVPKEEPEYPFEEMTNVTPDYAELWRPQYHYSTLDSWVNDPNGLVYYKGVWHMYYQLNPHTNVWGNLHWGHATSTDLVNWTEHEPALFPDSVGVMYSGTAVVDENNTSGFFSNTPEKQGIVAAYSTDTQQIGIAYSTDGFNFTKVSETKPVLERPAGVTDFRDPHIFWHEETNKWIMVVAGTELRIYSSPNLVNWTYCSVIKVNSECPNLLRIPVEGTGKSKWLLSCSGRGYYTGNFDGTTFTITSNYKTMNVGPDSYAGITFANAPDDRIIMVNWMNNWTYTLPEGKWNGAFTLPVEMSLKKVGHEYILFQNPVEEVKAVRGEKLLDIQDQVYTAGNPLNKIRSSHFEMELEIDLTKSGDFDLLFCKGLGEETRVSYSKQYKDITVNRSMSNFGFKELKDKNNNYRFNVEDQSVVDNVLKLRLFVDGSNMELYVNDGYYYFAGRIQPFTSSQAMKLAYADSIAIKKMTIYECKSIWLDELPSAVHLSSEKKIVLEEGMIKDDIGVCSLNGSLVKCKVEDESIASATIEGGYLTVKALKAGTTEIMVYCGKYYKTIKVTVTGEEQGGSSGGTEEGSSGNNLAENSANWNTAFSFSEAGMTATENGGAILKEKVPANATVTIETVGTANGAWGNAWLIIKDKRENPDASSANVASGDYVALRLGAEFAFDTPNEANQMIVECTNGVVSYHNVGWLAGGNNNDVWNVRNSEVTWIVTTTDTATGVIFEFTLRGFYGSDCSFMYISTNKNLKGEYSIGVGCLMDMAGGDFVWKKVTVEETSEVGVLENMQLIGCEIVEEDGVIYLDNLGTGDAFAFSKRMVSDVKISAQIKVPKEGAAAFLFRAHDTNNFYCVNIDTWSGIVKFWKKVGGAVTDVQAVAQPVALDTYYTLTIEAVGDSIKVYLNGDLVIDVTDTSFSEGLFGLNAWATDGYFKDLTVEDIKNA